MKAVVLKVKPYQSRMGGNFCYIFFKGEDGKSYFTCVYERFANYNRWRGIISLGAGTVVDNLNTKGKLIDADSWVKIVNEKVLLDKQFAKV